MIIKRQTKATLQADKDILQSEVDRLQAGLAASPPASTSIADPSMNNKATLYVVAVTALAFLTVAFVLLITLVRPNADNDKLITIVIGVVAPLSAALIAQAVQQVHLAVNSRLTQLVELTAKASKAEGVAEAQADSTAKR